MRNGHKLSDFGITPLTGECCPYGLRVLCDLTEQGKQLVEQFFGLQTWAENWNSGAIASCVIPRTCMHDLLAFCLLQSGTEYVVVTKGGFDPVYSCTEQEVVQMSEENYPEYKRIITNLVPTHPQRDGRCVHRMTGRAA